MARRRANDPLQVHLNNRLVGHLRRDSGGAISFVYDAAWLAWDHRLPISLSLPLTEETYRGARVEAVEGEARGWCGRWFRPGVWPSPGRCPAVVVEKARTNHRTRP